MTDESFYQEETVAAAEVNQAGLAWTERARVGDVEALWAGLDHEFRLAFAQTWILANPAILDDPLVTGSRDDFAAELAGDAPAHPLWPHLAAVAKRDLTSGWLPAIRDRELGTGSRPRPVAPDLELVRVIPLDQLTSDESGFHIFADGQTVECLTLVMRHRADGWRVAGIDHAVLTPGWPPQQQVVAGPAD